MKPETLLILGIAGFAIYYFYSQSATSSSAVATPQGGTTTNQGTTATAAKDAGTDTNLAPSVHPRPIHRIVTGVDNLCILHPKMPGCAVGRG